MLCGEHDLPPVPADDLAARRLQVLSPSARGCLEQPWGEAAQAIWDFVAGAKRRGLCDLIATRRGVPALAAESGGDAG